MASKKLRSTGDALAACDDNGEALGIVMGALMTYAALGSPVPLNAVHDLVQGLQRFNRMELDDEPSGEK